MVFKRPWWFSNYKSHKEQGDSYPGCQIYSIEVLPVSISTDYEYKQNILGFKISFRMMSNSQNTWRQLRIKFTLQWVKLHINFSERQKRRLNSIRSYYLHQRNSESDSRYHSFIILHTAVESIAATSLRISNTGPLLIITKFSI